MCLNRQRLSAQGTQILFIARFMFFLWKLAAGQEKQKQSNGEIGLMSGFEQQQQNR